jgi:hypothetical protein
VLEAKVRVEEDRLHPGQERVLAVHVLPPALHEAERGVAGEERDGLPEEARRRHEVGVEDGDELAPRDGQPRGERPGLVPGARVAMEVVDVEPAAVGRSIAGDGGGDEGRRLVDRIVEHLDLETTARPVEAGDGREQALDHVHLVEDGELHGHHGQRRRRIPRVRACPRAHDAVLVPVVAPEQVAAPQPEEGEDGEERVVGKDDDARDRRHRGAHDPTVSAARREAVERR